MIVYIDSENRIHVDNDGTMTPVEIDGMDAQCKRVIESYKYYPEEGFMVLYKDAGETFGAQAQYEEDREQMADMQEALSILGVAQ